MTASDAIDGTRRAGELLALLGDDATTPAEEFLAGLTDVRDLVFLGSALTTLGRSEGRLLPPAQRAQANTRQMNLGAVRDAARTDPDGLRRWVRQAAEEVLFLRSLQAAALARAAADGGGPSAAGR